MYSVMHDLLSDRNSDVVFRCFGIWHFIYLAVVFGGMTIALLIMRKKDRQLMRQAANLTGDMVFGLYIADFFLMPFAYGEIDLEKLPFHICTAMCVLCFCSRRVVLISKFRPQFVTLGLISNLIYTVYPAGVGWYQIHPLSYRVVQTLLFHGLMSAHCLLSILCGDVELNTKNWRKDLMVIITLVLWAMLGNTLYSGTSGNYSHQFNWFFVKQDPFYLLPAEIAPYIMPFAVVIAFFAVDILVCAVYSRIKNFALRK